MAGFLTLQDYNKQIQADQFNQILSNTDSVRTNAELAAMAEMKSYLVQKFDVTDEFNNTVLWSPSVTYFPGNLIQLNYGNYISTTSYSINDLVTNNSQCYICISDTTGTFNPSDWQLLGNLYDYYWASYPYPLFDVQNGNYAVGNNVLYKGKIYTCQIATSIPNQETSLQFGRTYLVSYPNVYPDDPQQGTTYWGTGTAYSITGLAPNAPVPSAWSDNTPYTTGQYVLYNGLIWQALTNNTNIIPGIDIINWQSVAWTYGDNRDQQIVQYMIDITLYHIHSRIAPRNIPELRVKRYDDAVRWLKMAMKGEVTPEIPAIMPLQGNRIRYGSDVKNINSY